MLKTYHWWKVYLDPFKDSVACGGNFHLAELFQIDANAVESDEINDRIVFSPPSLRPRRHRPIVDSPIPASKSKNPVNALQLQIANLSIDESWYDEPSTPAQSVANEQIVNTALDNFLRAITAHFELGLDWTIRRKAFITRFTIAEYEARTDGSAPSIKAIRDTNTRDCSDGRLAEKEAREQYSFMLICTFTSPKTVMRFSTSSRQYGVQYLAYPNGTRNPEPDDSTSFLTMHEVGRFATTNKLHMAKLGLIILAISLRAAEE
ncbi:hypothetical protein BDW75DRAFT_242413 [Aspergillus navahoensis]